MKIIETKIMRGPNQWSAEENFLIVQKIRSEDIADEILHDFTKKAINEFPGSLDKEASNENDVTRFLKYLATELQSGSGMATGYSRIHPSRRNNEFYLVFSYIIEQAGIYAGEAAVRITNSLLNNTTTSLSEHLEELRRLKTRYSIGPTSTYILNEVKKRKIPFRQFNHGSLISLGYGMNQKKIRTAVTDHTSALGLEMAGDKEETKSILADAGVPVPQGILVRSVEELKERLHEVKFPLVIKPLDGNHGRGVTTEINNLDKALFGFEIASRISDTVIVEEFVEGEDYRFLVINFKLVAVAKRMPAYITGNGISTIQQLIDEENKDVQRGDSSEHVLALIKIDDITLKILSEKKLALDSVLKKGERLILKDTANISAGGTAIDVTDLVHPDNKFMVERVARIFNLDICGVDIMATSVQIPITRDIGAVIEVNAGPGLRMHSNPQEGTRRNVAGPIMEMLFPNPAAARIPVVAITGTNGKTTTTRLVAHIAKQAGYSPGFCTSDGIYLDGHLTYEGDCTGYVSARQVLFDPSINFAVLECARGGIIRSGLGFDQCDIAIITNISADHLGMQDIDTLEDMARVKSVVARSCGIHGYTILNADDEQVMSMYEGLKCNIALFSLDAENKHIKEHTLKKGMAAVVENGFITIINGHKMVLDHVDNIPLSFKGRADFMIRNILASVLSGVISGFNPLVIKSALTSFIPSPKLTPGRMNLFEFDGFKVMVDYVHNSDGFREVKKFLDRIEDAPKTGIISVAGDRRDEDIEEVGKIAGKMFDTVIIRCDNDMRGRKAEDVAALLKKGIHSTGPQVNVLVISHEKDAIEHAIHQATKGSFIFICADKVKNTLKMVKDLQENLVH